MCDLFADIVRMPNRYQDIYPEPPLLDSAHLARPSAAELLTLEYFEAAPATMPEAVFDQHHVLLNLREQPHRVENWRDGVHRDFTYHKDEIVVTPAGVRSGWRWHVRSKVIVITLEPEKLERFAQSEVGILLTAAQLKNLPLFADPDICQAGVMLRDALASDDLGSAVMFESLARVFLIKLIQRYGDRYDLEAEQGFPSRRYKRVLDFIATEFGNPISLENLASEAALSPSHFARLFKRTIGQSPMQYVTCYRAEQARKLLADRDRPLAEIAIACGFADQAHFSRVFKSMHGQTPMAYRTSLTA